MVGGGGADSVDGGGGADSVVAGAGAGAVEGGGEEDVSVDEGGVEEVEPAPSCMHQPPLSLIQ